MKSIKRIIAVIIILTVLMSSSVYSAATADPDLTSRKDFLWGVCIHTPDINSSIYGQGNTEEQIHLAAELGVKIIRTGISSNISHTDKFVRLANAYGIKVMAVVSIPGKTYDADTAVDLERIKSVYKTYASRYDGKHGYGKIDYIQIDNEMDNDLMGRYGVATEGSSINNYNQIDLATLTPQVKAAVEGIKESGSDVKSVINFAFRHYGMLDYFYQNGVEWDVIGHDWYSDGMAYDESHGKTPYQIGEELYKKFGKEIILCEHNALGTGSDFDADASNWDIVVRAMQDYYNKDYVIGAIFYELCDEINRQTGDAYEREAHFGLCFTKDNGEIIGPKPIYTRIQKIIGGGTVEKLNWEEVEATYEIPKENNSDEADDYTSENQNSGLQSIKDNLNNSGGLRENVTIVEVTPDPVIKKNTATETTVKKIPYSSGKIFTIPIIISVVIGALALGYTVFTVFYILRKKKNTKPDLKTVLIDED